MSDGNDWHNSSRDIDLRLIWSVMEDGAGLWYCGKLSAIFIRYVEMILFRYITINLCFDGMVEHADILVSQVYQ